MSTIATSDHATIPETAAPEVEFISATHSNASTELNPLGTSKIDLEFFRTYVRTLEEAGFDYTLLGYGSNFADSFVMASAVGQLTERIKPIVALRPNTVFPTVAAQQLATLDQLTQGRAVVHLISGGSDAEQARQGDYLPKDRRYDRTSEYIDILRRSWTERAPFDHEGEFYKFEGFGPGFATYSGEALPVSIGGQSDPAFRVGGAKADIFSFWGEPLEELSREIDRVNGIAAAAGRATGPRFWVTFRPIIAPTDKLAWQKAHDYVGRIESTFQAGTFFRGQRGTDAPQNTGSQRALAFAGKSELYDRALWTKTAAATNAGGASTALVGSPETVAAAILDYIDRGASLVSIRGYDTLADVRDYGRHILPLVRQELAHRKATGQRGQLQAEHPGTYQPEYASYATAG
jgi:alkanesulfonate monooxygenase